MVEMELVGVRLELPANAPIVLLRESGGARRVLPIYIGGPEAAAIAYALENVQVPRPSPTTCCATCSTSSALRPVGSS